MNKKTKHQKKPRISVVTVELREDTNINWDTETASLQFLNSKGEISDKHLVSIGEGYVREGKTTKILRQLLNPRGGEIKLGSTTNYFDRYVGIDTSYKQSGEKFICATGSLLVNQALDHEKGLVAGEEINLLAAPRLCFFFKQGMNPERYGWMKAIDGLIQWDEYNPNFRYGVIVDSELDILPKINAREEPIFDSFYLPGNMSLIYASADSGRESFYNVLIKATDQIAAASLAKAIELYPSHAIMTLESQCAELTALTGHVEFNL
jgi:hypothetical protein